jgi:hypothetical protein
MKAAGLETETVDELRAAKVPRVVVGSWDAIRRDKAVAQIAAGPATSGVFARFAGDSLQALDVQAEPARALGPDAGLVAAVRSGDDPPTWVVTGAELQGVEAAAMLMRPADLESRYAVASDGGSAVALPVAGRSQ